MQWSNYLPQRAKVLAQRSNLTPQRAKNIANQRANITQWSNYSPQRAEILSQRSQRVNSTGKEYSESTGKLWQRAKNIVNGQPNTSESLVFLESIKSLNSSSFMTLINT